MKEILFFSSSRSDFGTILPIIKSLKKKKIRTKLIITGTHLGKKFGNTQKEFIKYKIKVDHKISILSKFHNEKDILYSSTNLIKKSYNFFTKKKYRTIIIVGDRYEAFVMCYVAYIFNMKIIHIAGGETTEGAMDEAFRHSITKMSNLHFVTNENYKRRVMQLGENPKNIIVSGDTSQEFVLKMKLYKKKEIEKILKINFKKKNILISFHPMTFDHKQTMIHLTNLLATLNNMNNTLLIFTYPNQDIGYSKIINKIKNFIKKNKNAFFFKNLGNKSYISILKNCDLLIGNSSSGITDTPLVKIPAINIGDRQKGRDKTNNVIDVSGNSVIELNKAIQLCYNDKFLKKIKRGLSNLSKKNSSLIISREIIKRINNSSVQKKFFDI